MVIGRNKTLSLHWWLRLRHFASQVGAGAELQLTTRADHPRDANTQYHTYSLNPPVPSPLFPFARGVVVSRLSLSLTHSLAPSVGGT